MVARSRRAGPQAGRAQREGGTLQPLDAVAETTAGSPLGVLIEASAVARATAGSACARGQELCDRARDACRRAERARLGSRPFRRYATVEGMIDGQGSVAVVFRDGSVTGHARVLRRIDLVAALEDSFDGGRIVASTREDPFVTTLTATRALDRVRAVSLYGLPPGANGDGAPGTRTG